ncbi:MAG: hypothetical protein KAJ18_00010 [Candidatus Omnitrophica bacterium]|nr:hypothetical protein [Candidatus Omnitrophota bacterium]
MADGQGKTYHHNLQGEDRKRIEKFIDNRCLQLADASERATDRVLKFLFLVNAGGAIAVLGYLGTDSDKMSLGYAKITLLFYCFGLMFVGFTKTSEYFRFFALASKWNEDKNLFYGEDLSWEDLWNNDNTRANNGLVMARFFGIASGVCLIVGLIIGGIALNGKPQATTDMKADVVVITSPQVITKNVPSAQTVTE